MYNFKPKTFISEENILKYVSDYDVFKYYIGDFKIGQAFNSPFRIDKKASFNIGYNAVTNKLYYNDYILGGGDFILFVMNKYALSYKEACNKIVIDLNLEDCFHLFNLSKTIPLEKRMFMKSNIEDIQKFKKEVNLSAKTRKWEQYDLDFWRQFGITSKTLEKYNVKPAEYAMIGEKIFKLDKYAYVFIENKDGIRTITIYQPYSETQKWLKNHDASVWYGWEQLPQRDNTLIITKSRKDIMAISELTGIAATALQNEKILAKPQVIEELRSRFPLIYVLFDNDFDKPINWGRQFAEKFSNEFNMYNIEIPDLYLSKDFSDLVQNHGEKVAKNLLLDLVSNALPF